LKGGDRIREDAKKLPWGTEKKLPERGESKLTAVDPHREKKSPSKGERRSHNFPTKEKAASLEISERDEGYLKERSLLLKYASTCKPAK